MLLEPPLDPSGAEARSLLRRELLHPEYHQDNLVLRLVNWLSRLLDRGLTEARELPPLTTFAAMLVGLLLLGALGWLVSRARRVQRVPRERRPVLTDEHATAADLRARAERALAEERYADALVDAFRAVAVRQVERHRIDDLPGRRAGGGVPRAGRRRAPLRGPVRPGAVRRPGGDARPGGRRARAR